MIFLFQLPVMGVISHTRTYSADHLRLYDAVSPFRFFLTALGFLFVFHPVGWPLSPVPIRPAQRGFWQDRPCSRYPAADGRPAKLPQPPPRSNLFLLVSPS